MTSKQRPAAACAAIGGLIALLGAAGAAAQSARSLPDQPVSGQFSMVVKVAKPGDPTVVTAYRTSERNGRVVVCQAFFVSGASPAVGTAYKARVDAAASLLEFKPAGEAPFTVPTRGAPVHFMPPPPDKPNGELRFDAIRTSGLPSRCIDTGRTWSSALNRLAPNPIIVSAP